MFIHRIEHPVLVIASPSKNRWVRNDTVQSCRCDTSIICWWPAPNAKRDSNLPEIWVNQLLPRIYRTILEIASPSKNRRVRNDTVQSCRCDTSILCWGLPRMQRGIAIFLKFD
jgi:hypothetical protein